MQKHNSIDILNNMDMVYSSYMEMCCIWRLIDIGLNLIHCPFLKMTM